MTSASHTITTSNNWCDTMLRAVPLPKQKPKDEKK